MRTIILLSMFGCLVIAGCPRVADVDDQGTIFDGSSNPQDDASNQDGTGSGDSGDQVGGSQDQAGGSDPGDGGGGDPPPADNNPPETDIREIPAGTYAGYIMAAAALQTPTDVFAAQTETPHIGNFVRVSDDGMPYVSDRWLSDGGGIAAEGLTTMRLVLAPENGVHLVVMSIETIEVESDLVRIIWSIEPPSAYTCDPGSCVDVYEYDAAADTVNVTTAVQLKWVDGGQQTLTVAGEAAFALR